MDKTLDQLIEDFERSEAAFEGFRDAIKNHAITEIPLTFAHFFSFLKVQKGFAGEVKELARLLKREMGKNDG